jgi:hypothetical protein
LTSRSLTFSSIAILSHVFNYGMVTCIDCVWAKKIDENIRLALSQENKEILNILERRGFDIDEFCYCERLGYIESVIMKRICEEYEPE